MDDFCLADLNDYKHILGTVAWLTIEVKWVRALLKSYQIEHQGAFRELR